MRQRGRCWILAAVIPAACSATDSNEVVVGDPSPSDAGAVVRDVPARIDVPALDAATSGADAGPGYERCGNGVDDDYDGNIDEDCACGVGMTQRCYPGDPRRAGVGTCAWGQQRCEGVGEFGRWTACAGATEPAEDVCGNGMDEDCNGRVDDGPRCCPPGGGTANCYTGPAGTAGVGICRAGVRMCAGGAAPGPCVGEVLPRAEQCNGVDDDCDGQGDMNCLPCIGEVGSTTAWQMHLGAGPQCWGRTFGSHGEPGEYAFARIPAEGDPGWMAHPPDEIRFDDPSTLCGVCECRAGGDFTYFQTSFFVPTGFTVRSLVVTIGTVDDGVQVTVFNSAHPTGIVDPGAYAYLGGGSTADLARYVVPGANRVVLTHVDDCCAVRAIRGATIRLNGTLVPRCPAAPM